MNRNLKIILICAFLFVITFSAIITVLVTKSEIKNNTVDDNKVHENFSKNDKKSADELKFFENFKNAYNEGRYLDANRIFNKFKEKYPSSKYISIIGNDYRDLVEKVVPLLAEEEEKRKIKESNFDNVMYSDYGDIYFGHENSEKMFSIFVNDDWNYLSKIEKINFVNYAVSVAQEVGLKRMEYYFIGMSTGRRVATWHIQFGVSIK